MTVKTVSSTTAAAIRLVLQVVVSGGFLVGVTAAVNSAGAILPGNARAAILAALVPVVAMAHKLVEDKGWIGTWLRQPTSAAAIARQAAKVQKAAAKEAAVLAKQAAKAVPAAAPAIDTVQAITDAVLAKISLQLPALLAQAQPPVPGVAPAVTDPAGSGTAP